MSTEPTRAEVERLKDELGLADDPDTLLRTLAAAQGPRLPAVEPVEPPVGPERGTGESGPETSAQAAGLIPADLIESNPVLHIDLTAADTPRGLVAIEINHTPDYPPATIPNEAMPHLVGLINALKVAHLNEAAVSLRTIADRMPDTASAAKLRPGIEYAATLLGHTADDMGAGDG